MVLTLDWCEVFLGPTGWRPRGGTLLQGLYIPAGLEAARNPPVKRKKEEGMCLPTTWWSGMMIIGVHGSETTLTRQD